MLRGDDRAQSVQVGAILLFGIMIVALATAQATVIPQQNAGTEFDHSQAIQSDMQELRNSLLRAAGGDASPITAALGTTYPNRLLFINPPPPTGELRTVGADDAAMNVTLANASSSVTAGSDYENARDYWANAPGAGEYNTSEVAYQPDYAEYDGAPTTIYGSTVLYNTFENGANRTLTGQRLVQGDTIDLLALRGDLEATGAGTETVEMETLSERARTVTVESGENDPLFVNVTSRLSADVWNDDLLGSNAEATDAGDVTIDGTEYHRIAIKLDEGTYRLRGGAVGVGAVSPTDRNQTTDPAYMVVTDGYDEVTNGSGETESITVEVRDRFNNPVTGAEVSASADGTHLGLVGGTTFETDSEGRATIEYEAIGATADGASLNVNIGPKSYEQANFTELAVLEFDLGGGGDGGELNPGTTGDLIQTDATLTDFDGDGEEGVNVTFSNTLGSAANITSVRLNFYHQYSGPSGNDEEVSPVDVSDGQQTLMDVEVGGAYRTFSSPIVVSDGSETVLNFAFATHVQQEDFFVLSLVFKHDGQTYRETYFVSP